MSRRTKLAKNPQSSKPAAKSASTWLYVAAVAVAVLILVGVYLRPENPQRLYEEAQEALDSNPAEAAMFAERATMAAGGDYPAAQLLWCLALVRQQQWVEALGCFGQISDPSACDTQQLIEIADRAGKAKEHSLQLLALNAANRPGPHQAEVLRRLVALNFATGDYDAALSVCEQWRASEPRNPQPLDGLVQLYRRRGDFVTAAELCRQALALPLAHGDQRLFRSALASMLVDLGEPAAARQEMDRLQKEGPIGVELQLQNVNLLRLERKPKEALTAVNALLQSQQDSPRALFTRGTLYLDAGDFQAARTDLDRVVKLEPNNKEAHYKLAQALRQLGKPDEAAEHLRISERLTNEAIRSLSAKPLKP